MCLFYDLRFNSTLTRLGQYTQLLRQPRLWSIAQRVLLHIYHSSLKNILKPYRNSAAQRLLLAPFAGCLPAVWFSCSYPHWSIWWPPRHTVGHSQNVHLKRIDLLIKYKWQSVNGYLNGSIFKCIIEYLILHASVFCASSLLFESNFAFVILLYLCLSVWMYHVCYSSCVE